MGQQEKQFKDLTIIELKAMAYDAIAQKEFWQNRLMEINQVIAKTAQDQKPVNEIPKKPFDAGNKDTGI